MATIQSRSAIASFGLAYATAAIVIAIVDALEAFVPSFAEWAEKTLGPPWLHLGLLGIVVFAGLGLAGIGHGQDWRRTVLTVIAATVVGGLSIFVSAMILGTRGGM
jgi:hypothetical protein